MSLWGGGSWSEAPWAAEAEASEAASTGVTRAPLVTSVPAAMFGAALAFVVPNLLLNTLQPAQDAPFKQTEWQVPAGKARQIPWVAPNLLLTTLAQQEARPFAQADWPNAPRKRALDGTWAQNLLQGTLTPQEQAAPFVPIVWNGPRRVQALDGTVAVNLLQSTLGEAAPAAVPFFPILWEMPRAPVRVYSFHGRPDQAQGATATPFVPVEWANPIRAHRSVELLTYTQSPQVPAPAAETPPYRTFDWPTPARRTSSLENAQLGGVLVEGEAPVASFDWPLPKLARLDVSRLTWTVNLLQGTLNPGDPQFPPGRQMDWPLPVLGKVMVRGWLWIPGQDLLASGATPAVERPHEVLFLATVGRLMNP